MDAALEITENIDVSYQDTTNSKTFKLHQIEMYSVHCTPGLHKMILSWDPNNGGKMYLTKHVKVRFSGMFLYKPTIILEARIAS